MRILRRGARVCDVRGEIVERTIQTATWNDTKRTDIAR